MKKKELLLEFFPFFFIFDIITSLSCAEYINYIILYIEVENRHEMFFKFNNDR